MKEKLFLEIDKLKSKLIEMGDYIFDNPEYGGKEIKASNLLTEYLSEAGFKVEKGIADLPTSFIV